MPRAAEHIITPIKGIFISNIASPHTIDIAILIITDHFLVRAFIINGPASAVISVTIVGSVPIKTETLSCPGYA